MIIFPQTSGNVGIETVGGKAMSLLALTRRGFRVPPFLVISAAVNRSHVSGRVSDELRARLREGLNSIGGPDRDYAVRSSGLAEDSVDFSYAGVFETLLDVRGEDALVSAVEQCWASHGSGIAAAYRAQRGISDDSAMAVVVQRMVRAEWAGVSFSADPLTQALSVCVINSARGLGDELVSGRVNPEQIRIESATGRVLEHQVPPGLTPLPEQLRIEVLRQTLAAQAAFGFPQDLEWATEGDELFLLQSRPITTLRAVFHNRALEPWAGQGDPDAADRVWTRAYADEVWAPPLTPLFYDVQNLTLVTGQQLSNGGDPAPVPPDVFKYFKAAAYMDAAVLQRLYATLPPLARRPSLLLLLPPEFRATLAAAPWNWRGTLGRLWKFEFRRGRTFGLNRNHEFLEHAWPAFLTEAHRLAKVNLRTLGDEQLNEYLGKVWALALSVAPQCEVAVLYYSHDLRLLLTGLLQRWFGEGAEKLYAEVSSGLDHSKSVRETDEIWELAQAIRAAGPRVCAAAAQSDWDGFLSQALGPQFVGIIEHFQAFLRDHGHRGANYKDMIYPRWGDDPNLLWMHVKGFLSSSAQRPSTVNARSGIRRKQAQAGALEAVKGQWLGLKAHLLRWLFKVNEIYAGLRDNHRFYYDYVWWFVRRVYLEKGRRLATAGLLAAAQDVVFLSRKEIDALAAGELPPPVASIRITVRRREWEETRIRPPPRFLRRGYLPDDPSEQSATSRKLTGLAASPGQARGRARIVLDVAGLSAVVDGDILVARQTDPGWTPAFARLAGLVLETGGVLAHGASLCREYGLPCVTAVDGATAVIRDGDIIRISGSDGAVEIL